MPELLDIGERAIISRLMGRLDPDGIRMLGDDCAILEMGDYYLLLTTDMITRATHMPEGAKPQDIGWYAAAINLSDIAAMGGEPLGMLFALGLPIDTASEWLDALYSGIQECCDQYNAPILGGDTKENSNLTISGVAVGRVPKGHILRRSGAKPGDILAMTGSLGRGLLWERNKSDAEKLLRVEPRVEQGITLARSGAVSSCIDISDGLSTCLHLMSKASQIGFEVEESVLPMVPGLDAEEKELAIHWGGDFELLFTVRPEMADKLFSSMPGITRIGRVTSDISVTIENNGTSQPLEDLGYEHFGEEGKA
ncbi:MAG: thiamine-phosphate kinase [Candidatus Thermoplasmatota archaeon]|nr:thiamine-phosphate kinase [Candidatus Thermoplasmatota archaeon]MBU4071554.1 thiamine-phosphate kinase [Candidatus Thermoplasmatota archaeon]MBU4144486.1 thiamine-phosphate kinase [Candidatus Thermoplasmatota archaeon]MBU4592720.1 thiamine-phosphate kinase [Candidatus Thermoplasmatota archaeon]